MTIIYFLIVLGFCVFIHEYGHFLFARLNGVRVETFSIGMGSKEIFGWTDKHGTRWKIAPFPLGGYCKMYGQEDVPTEIKQAKNVKNKSEHFQFKSIWQRASIVVGGPLFNFISAFIIIWGLFAFAGVPKTPTIIDKVSVDMPAAKAGLKSGDKIIQVNNRKIEKFRDLQAEVGLSNGKELTVQYKRDNEIKTVKLTPVKKDEQYLIGIQTSVKKDDFEKVPFSKSFTEAGKEFSNQLTALFRVINQMVKGERSGKELGGFIQIAEVSKDAANAGWYSFLFLIAFLSINLGLMNLLPIPVLDGGHLVFLAVEGITRKPLNEKVFQAFSIIGFSFLAFIMVYATINDIIRAIGG